MSLSTRLFVGNLPDNYNEDSLREAFSSYGEITNFDVKCKPTAEKDKKIFAFISLSASNYNVESCIQHFSEENYCGHKLYVTRARESFLERLQREREQSVKKNEKTVNLQDHLNIKKNPLSETFNSHKRKFNSDVHDVDTEKTKSLKVYEGTKTSLNYNDQCSEVSNNIHKNDEKKYKSDEKRLESIKRKRQEFNEKKRIIKTGLTSIDKQVNKKVVFSDSEDEISKSHNIDFTNPQNKNIANNKVDLFEGYESEDNTNFDIKKQYEGKKGQKILELQSKYKSDKRFILDERFVEEETGEDAVGDKQDNQEVEIGQADERSKQLNILQDLLGVSIPSRNPDINKKTKSKPGMLRFDPTHPEHAKFFAHLEVNQEAAKKAKKKKSNKNEQDGEAQDQPIPVEKVEVSKDQFYKISDSLKETISQPKEFSLRSLFAKNDIDLDEHAEGTEAAEEFIPLQTRKDKKIKNPLDIGEKNPFVYDSTDSENEDDSKNQKVTTTENVEHKSVWKEKLFFTNTDNRLKDGLLFFCKVHENEGHKDRRELKSLMKKRIYNKDRKNHMFQKKIGGRKKTMKKSFRKKS